MEQVYCKARKSLQGDLAQPSEGTNLQKVFYFEPYYMSKILANIFRFFASLREEYYISKKRNTFMNAYKAKYSNGMVRLLEQPPQQLSSIEQNVVVLFLNEESENESRSIPAKNLLQLAGIVSLGGDAVKDKKALYDQ